MKYLLYFSLSINRQGSCIIFDPAQFTEQPISLSIPELIKIFTDWIGKFEEVGIIESPKDDKKIYKNNKQHLSSNLTDSHKSLKGISGKAYVCKLETLKSEDLELFCDELARYWQECCSKISLENFLVEENNLYLAGLREVIEIRNYIVKYIKSKQKIIKNGYIYIQVL
jgi:hypothetical protein